MVPIYIVVLERLNIQTAVGLGLTSILEVIPVDLQTQEQLDRILVHINVWYASGRNIQVLYILREPANPFRDWQPSDAQVGQIPENVDTNPAPTDYTKASAWE